MATLVFSMNQSIDGYVDHDKMQPSPVLFRHFVDHVAGLAGSLYGRRMYEIMRVWDDDAGWDAEELRFAHAWRNQPKWVVSHGRPSLGPNASLVRGDLGAAVRELKASHEGEIDVAGPDLARTLTDLGLIDEYHLYIHPVVLGDGTPFFAGARPPLRLTGHDMIDGEVIRLTYVPA